ncbi:AbrB/MazE/SpoVT family DNA-binding domain-containing protein [Sporosarcina sp. FSL W7-1349]|uniref:AbrB/MazE/SpoVT family DNA-binding domain-containing protein n=1 Tax=Bacillales TaxID=1385 RepID=UPI000581CE26|nr:AbrB/MazE/SpoVT family DNA-binding domain-containing protein [Bacillus sp. OxB-1]BAQ10149.1 polyphosphate kinase [Bacillus sp. OxB-1]
MVYLKDISEERTQMRVPKKIAVSRKRQITIPIDFYEQLEIGDEVICEVVDNSLVIRPISEPQDFSEYILRDLINEGYESGEELLKEFSYRKSQIKPALEQMIAESRDGKVYSSPEEFFSELDEDEDE